MERCDGCGFVWDLVPSAEIPARVAETGTAFRRLLLPVDRPAGWAERAGERAAPGVWSAVEYACHVRDVLFVQRDRLYLALVVDEPTFPPMYREERVQLARYGEEDLGEVVTQLEIAAQMLARSLGVLDSGQWQRTVVYGYPTTAVRTLAWFGAQALHEMLHHAADIAAALAPHEAGLAHVRRSPAAVGVVELIVRRPAIDEREVLAEAELDLLEGLVGDSWNQRPSNRTSDRTPHPDMQLNLMNARAAALVAGERERWPLAGDQLYLDLDLSEANLPAGTRLALGSAVIEITNQPHRGCNKFSARFGPDALRLVNSAVGRELRLRGVNARVVVPGTVRQGDAIRRIDLEHA